ncbi:MULTISPECIES: aminopeptidase P family protein [Bacteroides]|jgi:Xaa-Pro aminopeptidase|uniref:aminopeptidase P family protein n=1 Tax=Bacteroides TaxID=816 RepID=UPI000E492EE4|nr:MULTISPECIES: aminopeptidase P family protein [Bacteroides]MBU8971135.1 aminopeptidase P family protein [Bacteroides eggerthii]MBU8995529.1 aminopeptidase P family protein [Bacteroides eggerthii]MBU8995754.1 aminopeptidase P family protein [Bacteroides eggerthii]MCG4756982.1 aminopeptidase P family protein [Bacteroides eggerthii]MCG4757205.1 aminopeptidase P family protein [Bacteroides eggerthii]
MNSTINNRIAALRAHIAQEQIQAFIIPSTDPHLSEYVAPHWQSREWISGFTGSAGTVVVTAKDAGLWTDSRYFLQAARQLEGTCITLYKEMLPETPNIPEFLSAHLQEGDCVGIDGKMFSAEEVEHLQKELKKSGIRIKSIADPMQLLWTDRPAMPLAPAFVYDTKYAGMSFTEKLPAVRQAMEAAGADSLLLSALDEIAWLLNIRGNDVHCNPVVVSYLLIEKDKVNYFVQPQKVTPELAEYFSANGISVHPYEEIGDYLNSFNAHSILMNPAKTNYAIYSAIRPGCLIINGASPVALLKAIRNKQEIAGIHAAMQRDGVALVKFLKWLDEAVPAGKETEISVDKKLHTFRAAQPLYMGESFDTIAGYKEHGAIVHYEATPETDVTLKPEGFLLLDSGAQYLDGTTDITRTIALGPLTEEEKTDYTLILKGHIALAMAVFPEGTRGAQLDVLARMPIWKERMNYLHGTGHGVGHFLNVHEGPQSIRMNENPVALQPGMVTSNEPGVYKAGSHGIRTENLVLTVPAGEGMFGKYLKFETLTLCPICRKGIIKELLTAEEIGWLNDYHRTVYEKLSPDLNNDEREWLKEACKAVIRD